jgi:epoxyqueuosine reductase
MKIFAGGAAAWLTEWMAERGISLWGAADVRDCATPRDVAGDGFNRAIAWAEAMDPDVMVTVRSGPNRAYADAYAAVNARLNRCAAELEGEICRRGFRAQRLAASERTDPVNIRGDFPHKSSATRAGLGWVGRHCQLITRPFGSWVRLGTVFTDMPLPAAKPATRGFCGSCRLCVEACPAGALTGHEWRPGVPREKILDVRACDRYKKEHFFQYHNGHNCGICSAVCPYGLKYFKQRAKQRRS